MFARTAFRTAQQPLKGRVRRYATEAPKRNSTPTAAYVGLAAASLASAYYLLYRPAGAAGGAAASTPTADAKNPHPSQEVANVPGQLAGAPAKATFTGGDQGWVDLKLEKVDIVNHNTKRFRFALPEEDAVTGLRVASALLVKYQPPGKDKPVIRPYTPISDESAKGYLELLVKRYPNGPMSEHLHSMAPEQRLDFKGPLPKYAWAPNKHEHVCLIAGGTGITPMYQLCRAIFANPADRTKVTLVFGNVTADDILLKHELDALENTYPQRFRAFYMLDRPPPGWAGGGQGHISKELLQTVLPGPGLGERVKLFVCGPPGMYNAISGPKKSVADQGELGGILKELGYTKEQVYKF